MPSLAVFGHRTTTFSFVLVWVHESSEHDAKPCDDSLLRNTSHCSLLRMSPVHGPGLVYLEHKYPQYIASYIRQCLCTVSEATRHPRTSSPVTSCILRPFAEAHSTKFVTRCTGFLCAVYPESRSAIPRRCIRQFDLQCIGNVLIGATRDGVLRILIADIALPKGIMSVWLSFENHSRTIRVRLARRAL